MIPPSLRYLQERWETPPEEWEDDDNPEPEDFQPDQSKDVDDQAE